MTTRPIELSVHNALVLATAPLLMIVPYLLTFSPGIGFLTFFLGASLMGVSLAGSSPARPLSLTAQSGFDWALGIAIFAIGILSGLSGQDPMTTIFLVGFGAAHLALTVSTRYSARGA
ncbi:MAG: hypothetical protein KDB66_02295 [Solirubrobacterales bacterium]|nr:hypothetical protein [Solirubrobacterales bacterium]MCB8915288.1 hypothetical protein [Thermoleophilales bacterium]